MKTKRLFNTIHWVPLHHRIGRFGFPLSQKIDKRKPIFCMTSLVFDNMRELFFINDSGETLDFVKAEEGGFTSYDDGMMGVSTKDNCGYSYNEVLPRETVKVSEFDDYYDLDYMLAVSVTIKTPTRGILSMSSPLIKGGIEECVLLYDSYEVGKGCHVKTT